MMEEKIKGIVFAYTQANDTRLPEQMEMLHDLGITWLRMHLCFPWTDRMYGTLSAEYLSMRQDILDFSAAGFHIMPVTPGLGGWSFDSMAMATRWKDEFPSFAGRKGTEAFYENVRKTTEFICRDLGNTAGPYWQCMNEIDNPIFSDVYSRDIVVQTARASAEGIVRADPDACCGINLSNCTTDAIAVADSVYAPGHAFGYIGDDQYFGSWQEGDVSSWTTVIDTLYERYKLPVLVNEWGYSSGGTVSTTHVPKMLIPRGLPEECFAKTWFHTAPGGHNEQVQADYLSRGIQLFAAHPHCLGSFLFCFRDADHCYHCGGTDCPSEDFWGIVTSDLKKKPAYEAVKKSFTGS